MSTKRTIPFIPTLSPEQASLLLKTTFDHRQNLYGVIFTIIIYSRLTMKSVLNLQPKDINSKNCTIKDIKVPDFLAKGFEDAINEEQPEANEKFFDVSARRVFTVFKLMAKKAGLDPVYSPYSLRHVLGKHYKFGGYLKGVKKK